MARPKGKLSVFSDGLDYVVLRRGEGGVLTPLPDVPRFVDMATARRWLRSNAAEALAGQRVAVVRFHALADIVSEARVKIELKEQGKSLVGGDVGEAEADSGDVGS